jgi:hypothetical protein
VKRQNLIRRKKNRKAEERWQCVAKAMGSIKIALTVVVGTRLASNLLAQIRSRRLQRVEIAGEGHGEG